MLPPIDDAVLAENPDFAAVYKKITTVLLNPDASTRRSPDVNSRHAVREQLQQHRLRVTRRQLLRQALASTASASSSAPAAAPSAADGLLRPGAKAQPHRRNRSSVSLSTNTAVAGTAATPLPPDLLAILDLLPPFLAHPDALAPERLALILASPPLCALPAHFPQLLTLVSARLARQASQLARAVFPATNPSFIHRSVPSLPSAASTARDAASAARAAAAAARREAASSLAALLAARAEVLAALLRALEAKHGVAARGTALAADAAAARAAAWALAARALRAELRARVYPSSARAALSSYRAHLGGARMRLIDAARVREAELRDYGVQVVAGSQGGGEAGNDDGDHDEGADGSRGEAAPSGASGKERTMREMARVWRDMEARMREVDADMARLGVA